MCSHSSLATSLVSLGRMQLLVCSRTHACTHRIPHAGFARFSLARLSLINLFGRTIVRNAADNLIGRKGPTMQRQCNTRGRGLHQGGAAIMFAWTGSVCFSLVPRFCCSPLPPDGGSRGASRVCRANPSKPEKSGAPRQRLTTVRPEDRRRIGNGSGNPSLCCSFNRATDRADNAQAISLFN